MADWDAAPRLDPETGLPIDFMRMPLDDHIAIWRKAPELMLLQDRYSAVLVSMHGAALYRMRNLGRLSAEDRHNVRAYLDEQEGFQQRLIETLAADPEELAANQRLILTLDALSLALLLEWAPHELNDVPGPEGAVTLTLTASPSGAHTLDPWPFGEASLTVSCDARRIDGTFEELDFELGG